MRKVVTKAVSILIIATNHSLQQDERYVMYNKCISFVSFSFFVLLHKA